MSYNRKGISKKLRFEVFKRDSFTCQYCGRMAPDVILEIDHINPVKEGGTNDIMNLITSCFDCNRGKGKRKLSANEELKKQQEQLKLINEKRNQLEMLLRWKEELNKFEETQVDEIEKLLSVTNNSFSDYGREDCKKTIKKYGFDEVYESTKISLKQYYDGSEESITKTFNMIPRICYTRERDKKEPLYSKKKYIEGTLRNKFPIYNQQRLNKMLNEIIVSDEDYYNVYDIAKNCNCWSSFFREINNCYEGDY